MSNGSKRDYSKEGIAPNGEASTQCMSFPSFLDGCDTIGGCVEKELNTFFSLLGLATALLRWLVSIKACV